MKKDLWLPSNPHKNKENIDPQMITCEVKNLMGFPIYFTSMRNQDPFEWRRIKCDANGLCHLPHKYYMVFNAEDPYYKGEITLNFRYGNERQTPCPYDRRVANTHEKHIKVKAERKN